MAVKLLILTLKYQRPNCGFHVMVISISMVSEWKFTWWTCKSSLKDSIRTVDSDIIFFILSFEYSFRTFLNIPFTKIGSSKITEIGKILMTNYIFVQCLSLVSPGFLTLNRRLRLIFKYRLLKKCLIIYNWPACHQLP